MQASTLNLKRTLRSKNPRPSLQQRVRRRSLIACWMVFLVSILVVRLVNADTKVPTPQELDARLQDLNLQEQRELQQRLRTELERKNLADCLNDASTTFYTCLGADEEFKQMCIPIFGIHKCKLWSENNFSLCTRIAECARLACHGLPCNAPEEDER